MRLSCAWYVHLPSGRRSPVSGPQSPGCGISGRARVPPWHRLPACGNRPGFRGTPTWRSVLRQWPPGDTPLTRRRRDDGLQKALCCHSPATSRRGRQPSRAANQSPGYSPLRRHPGRRCRRKAPPGPVVSGILCKFRCRLNPRLRGNVQQPTRNCQHPSER